MKCGRRLGGIGGDEGVLVEPCHCELDIGHDGDHICVECGNTWTNDKGY